MQVHVVALNLTGPSLEGLKELDPLSLLLCLMCVENAETLCKILTSTTQGHLARNLFRISNLSTLQAHERLTALASSSAYLYAVQFLTVQH